ncbi:MAG: DUF1622 domain-containing protein [Chthoniobacteraceae bacterium]
MEPPANPTEGTIIVLVQWLKLGIETVGVVLVATGVCVAIVQLARVLVARQPSEFTGIRLTLARYLALALEFELGADILGTAVSPSWDQIGKLGAVAVIRTGLNFFLSMEMRQEKTLEKGKTPKDACVT